MGVMGVELFQDVMQSLMFVFSHLFLQGVDHRKVRGRGALFLNTFF